MVIFKTLHSKLFTNFNERFLSSFEIFSASLFEAVDAKLSRSFDDFDVFFSYWEVLTLGIVYWGIQ